jgi:cytochrome P450
VDRVASSPRVLTDEEKQELRRDMAESSAWAKAELKRRRTAKNQKILCMVSMMVSAKVVFLTSCYLVRFHAC